MPGHRPVRTLLAASIVLLLTATAAQAQTIEDAVATFDYTKNMHPQGFSERANPPGGPNPNSDLAFWGRYAFQGHYQGFRIIDISDPENPTEVINYQDCLGDQGDLIVYGDILVRSWNSPATASATCGGQLVGQDFEGLHIFDISDITSPQLVGSVPMMGPIHLLTVDPPSSAAGTYSMTSANFGPLAPLGGISGEIALVNDGSANPTHGCEPLIGFPAGAIALADRGTCTFVQKALMAQAAGAVALVVGNNAPGAPVTLGGASDDVTIPSGMISLADTDTIKAGLPATGSVARNADFGCGSHTATGVPDLENDRLLVYNSSSTAACDFFEIVEVPLDDPGSASILTKIDSMHTCHDIGVILGEAMRLACAGGSGARIFSLHEDDGASLENPALMHHFEIPGVTIGHSAAWTWDGEVLIFGHEPGGGSAAECQATSPLVNRTLFFYDHMGNQLGTFVHPRPQTAVENCTWHNYNVVPTDKAYVLVAGNYQSGISVVDFSDPANAREIAYADPAPLGTTLAQSGGDWSSYWYNGRIYQSDMRRGLLVWNLSDRAVAGAKRFAYLNPQTQETTFPKSPAFPKGGKG
jgi:hypothetical protein